jgi:hypothetical protein
MYISNIGEVKVGDLVYGSNTGLVAGAGLILLAECIPVPDQRKGIMQNIASTSPLENGNDIWNYWLNAHLKRIQLQDIVLYTYLPFKS